MCFITDCVCLFLLSIYRQCKAVCFLLQAVILLLLSQQSPVRWVVLVHVISTMYLVGHLTQFQSVWLFSGSGYLISLASLILVLSTIALKTKKTMKDVSV